MVTPITSGELAALIPHLPKGEMRDWCELSSAGQSSQLVYADTGMLSRCLVVANSSIESETTPIIESNNEDVQGQRGPAVDAEPDPIEDAIDS